jgi:transcriptional regulator with PAS, ATPase and Fis domain
MDYHPTSNIEYIQCCRKYLEELLRRTDYVASVRYFELMKGDFDNKSAAERGGFMSMGSRAYIGAGNPSKALGIIRSAIALLSDSVGDKTELGDAHIVLGDTLRELGEYDEAERAFRDAESIYRRDDNPGGAGDALNRLAGIFYRRSNYKNALICLMSAIEFARKEDNRQKLAFLFGNIGRVYILLGQLNKAEEYVRFNIDLSQKQNDDIEETRARLSLAYIDIQRCQFESANKHLKEAISSIDKHNLKKERIIYLTYRGELDLKLKKFDSAEKAILESAEQARKIAPESNLAARPLRWMADLLVASGNYRRALTIANQALLIMKKLGNVAETGALLRICAVCQEELHQNDKARQLYLDSIRILEQNHINVELASALFAAGKSALFESGKKIMFLCRAEEIFAGYGAVSKVEQLQKTIETMGAELHKSEAREPKSIPEESSLPEFPTRNNRMKKIVSQLQLLRKTDLPILITGETGVGKDFLARYFHSIARPDGPYIPVNCAAIPDSLLESELFGYHKGAFTGAETNRAGLFRAADKGVLLLDEIGELPLALQAKLLSILETKKLRPLGTSDEIELDIIILAATNRDLSEMVAAGAFRQDLYYRLAGITMEIPSLRERREDIPDLLELFLRKAGLLSGDDKPEDDLVFQFVNHEWPGNIRQMENKVSQLKALMSISKNGSLSELVRGFLEAKIDEGARTLFEKVEAFEKKLLMDALLSTDGNKSQAARILSIHESTFRAKMKRYSIRGTVN